MDNRFQKFTVLISNIARNIRRIKTGEMDDFNLKSTHVSCLYYIYKAGAMTSKELCDACQEDKAAVSRSVEYLETQGYISCNSNLEKRYKSPFILTDKGIDVASEISKKIDNILDKASEGLAIEHREILYNSLELINNNLNQICDKYGE